MMRRPDLPMAPASLITGLAVAFFLAPALAAAGPVLSGSFRADPYASLELTTEGERVTGVVVDGGACRFDAPRRVMLEGEFQGSVLVGRLTLCQTGDKCAEAVQAYPILGFYSPEDSALVAHVRLSEGCQSPALKAGRFVLVPARKEASDTPTTTNSAVEIVARRNVAKSGDEAKKALERGEQLYKERKYSQAAEQFDLSLYHDSGNGNWPAYLGRGSSRLKLGQVEQGLKDLEKSLRIKSREPGILYMLACAWGQKGDKKKALDFLERAVNQGYALHAYIEGDPELKKFLAQESKFQELLEKSQKQQAQSRGSAGPGTLSP
jgi:tetratricopeptide (TPR) repeat protein